MENSATNTILPKRRIGSIDALRAMTLLGIVVVHAHNGFCTKLSYSSLIDVHLASFINFFLVSRCSIIFNILFGVSFYIILKKKDYPSSKFVWRCFLLFLIGIINKLFYWPDALMWYGMCGMTLVLVRNVKTRYLLWIALLLYVLTFYLRQLNLHQYLPDFIPNVNRYTDHPSFRTVLSYWPYAVFKYLCHILKSGVFWCLANMIIGYWIGRVGIIEKMDKRIDWKIVLLAFFGFALGLYLNSSISHYFIRVFRNLTGFAFYSTAFIFIYNKCPFLSSIWRLLENYGKLGLTNYSAQGMIAVFLLCDLGFGFIGLSPSIIIFSSIVLFVLQVVFSTLWLKKFRNGPLEWLWRCSTERAWIPLKK